MRLYDISMPITLDMPVYKNREDKRPVIEQVKNGEVLETLLTMNLHSGTHVDGVRHMVAGGADVKEWGISVFVGSATVLDFSSVKDKIKLDDLKEKRILEGDFVLLKTRQFPMKEMDLNFTYLSPEAAKYLVEIGVRGVGIDQLGIERGDSSHPTHHILFEDKKPIIEGLELSDIDEGRYNMVGLPLNIDDVEAAPMRVILVEFRFDDLLIR